MLSRYCILFQLAWALTFLLSCQTRVVDTHFRISFDAPPGHIATATVYTFLERLNAATDGAVLGTLFHSGQLYAARDEPKAVARGDVDMALTTNTWLSAFSPNYAVFDLPLFSGRSVARVNRLVDGPLGDRLAEELKARLDVIVPGRMLLLGFANTFGATKEIRHFSDLEGTRVRVPGGKGFGARYRALGAVAMSIPFPDVPLALAQGTVDALLTTDETVRSTELYEAGVTSIFVDQVTVIYYTPLVNKAFWEKLHPKHRAAFVEAWESVVDEERLEAVRQQAAARTENARHGVRLFEPTAEELDSVNARLWALIPQIAAQLDIDPEIVELLQLQLDSQGGRK